MKIQLGNVLMNKTKKYISPVLKVYGTEFIGKFQDLIFKLAYGLGDIITVSKNITIGNYIFVLIDSRQSKDLNSFLNWIREPFNANIYEEDYAYDDLSEGFLHVLVLKFPEQFRHILEPFNKGEYSKMYTTKEINELISDVNVAKVLIKDETYKEDFSKQLYDEFKVVIKPTDIGNHYELDFPAKIEEEVINNLNFSK